MSQIAGRAGRFKNDGKFGTTGECETLNSDEIEKIEKHLLPATKMIFWRNSKLNFSSPEKLISSLELKPGQKNLLRTNDSLDESVLRFFLKKGNNNIIYHNNLELLWNVVKYLTLKKRPMDNISTSSIKFFSFYLLVKKNSNKFMENN